MRVRIVAVLNKNMSAFRTIFKMCHPRGGYGMEIHTSISPCSESVGLSVVYVSGGNLARVKLIYLSGLLPRPLHLEFLPSFTLERGPRPLFNFGTRREIPHSKAITCNFKFSLLNVRCQPEMIEWSRISCNSKYDCGQLRKKSTHSSQDGRQVGGDFFHLAKGFSNSGNIRFFENNRRIIIMILWSRQWRRNRLVTNFQVTARQILKRAVLLKALEVK